MAKESKKWVTYVKEHKRILLAGVMIVLLFGGGVGCGYYIWGIERGKTPDYKKYLQKTVEYIASIEATNKNLGKEVRILKADVALLKKKTVESTNKLASQTKSFEEKVATLERENAGIKAFLTENQAIEQENVRLREKIEELTGESASLKTGESTVPAEVHTVGDATKVQSAEEGREQSETAAAVEHADENQQTTGGGEAVPEKE